MTMNSQVTAVILAGGQGQRMHGRDKGLLSWHEQPLIAYVIDRIGPQVHTLIISCNRHLADYSRFGYATVVDQHQGFPGPLAGIYAASRICTTAELIVVPCDSPKVPLGLVARLTQHKKDREIAVPHDGQRLQSLFSLLSTGVTDGIDAYLAGGNRSVTGWITTKRWTSVDFADEAGGFINLNGPQDLRTNSPEDSSKRNALD